MRASDLPLLAAPFASADVEWKPGAVTRDKTKGLAMAYLSNRAVQDRLDAVCGPADWRNEYRPGPDGGVVCGLSVYVEREGGSPEWVTKWDGADNTDVEAVKGGLSGSMKRAAVMWGIGRSLYSLPAQWVRLDERGRFAEPPRLPQGFGRNAGPARPSPAPRPAATRPEPTMDVRPEAPRPPAQRPEAARPEAPQRPNMNRPDAQARPEAPPRPTAPQNDATRPGPPDARGRIGQQRIVRPAPGRPGEGDGGSRVVDPGF